MTLGVRRGVGLLCGLGFVEGLVAGLVLALVFGFGLRFLTMGSVSSLLVRSLVFGMVLGLVSCLVFGFVVWPMCGCPLLFGLVGLLCCLLAWSWVGC